MKEKVKDSIKTLKRILDTEQTHLRDSLDCVLDNLKDVLKELNRQEKGAKK